MTDQDDQLPSFQFKPPRVSKLQRKQMRSHPLFVEVLRAYSLCKRPILGPIPPLEASEEVLFKEFSEEDHALLKDAEGEDVDSHPFAQEDVPEEEMTAFLENTISTFKAHRSEIEGLIKIRDGCCDQYMDFLRNTWTEHLRLRAAQRNFGMEPPGGSGGGGGGSGGGTAGGSSAGAAGGLNGEGGGLGGGSCSSKGAGSVSASGGGKERGGAVGAGGVMAGVGMGGGKRSRSAEVTPPQHTSSADAVTPATTAAEKNACPNDGDHDVDDKYEGSMEERPGKRRRENLPSSSVQVLRRWMLQNVKRPYPTDADKVLLAKRANITAHQVSNWFVNARKRIWQQMLVDQFGREQATSIMPPGWSWNTGQSSRREGANSSKPTGAAAALLSSLAQNPSIFPQV